MSASSVADFFDRSVRPSPPVWALSTPAGPPDMWAFIDDSGDAGMKLGQGSSKYLVMSACIFRDPQQIEALSNRSDECAARRSHKTEFKYSKTKEKTKHLYFEAIDEVDFSIRIIWADKQKVYSPVLRGNGSLMKAYLIKMLLSRSFGTIQNAKVVVDGQDLAGFGLPDREYLMGLVNRDSPGTIHSVKFEDSARSRPIQLADMTAGATMRHLEKVKENPSRHFYTFQRRTWQPHGTLWNFTR